MGCDIEMYAEIKIDNKWQKVGDIFYNSYYNKKVDEPYSTRNYHLFSMLANVRNNEGKYRINPIAEPKGLPSDVSKEVKEEEENNYYEKYSHSYLYLYELDNYDWNQEIDSNHWDEESEEIEKYKTLAGDFFTKTIPQLKKIHSNKPFINTRIVFWFG